MKKAKDDGDRKNEKKNEPEKKEERTGIARSVLKGLGTLIPGLDHIVEAAGKSETLRERLEEVDEEVERRLREGWSGSERSGPGLRSIPPGRVGGGTPSKEARPPRPPIRADLLEEGSKVRVIAEIPGTVEEDIRVELEGARLVLAADSPGEPRFGEFVLPRPCAVVLERRYKNGVLDLLLGGDEA
jgi:HSP20 family molecular chaperone IbpA